MHGDMRDMLMKMDSIDRGAYVNNKVMKAEDIAILPTQTAKVKLASKQIKSS